MRKWLSDRRQASPSGVPVTPAASTVGLRRSGPPTQSPFSSIRRGFRFSIPISVLSPSITPQSIWTNTPLPQKTSGPSSKQQPSTQSSSLVQPNRRSTEIKTAALNTMKLGLKLAEKVADVFPVPGVKFAVGGLMLVVERLDTVDQNKDDFSELVESINTMQQILNMVRQNESPLGHQMAEELKIQISTLEEQLILAKDHTEIEDLRFRLAELRSQRAAGHRSDSSQQQIDEFESRLEKSKAKIEQSRRQGKFRGFVNAQDDAQTVVAQFRDLGININQLLVSKTLDIEAQLADVQANLLLDKLPRAKGARYDFVDRPKCLQGTRTGVLGTITDWFSTPQNRQIYWLNGGAGTGKTTVALTLAERVAEDQSIWSASFFCSRGSGDRSQIKNIFPTLAYHLAQFNVDFRNELVRVLRQDPDTGYAPRDVQFRKLILEPLAALKPFLEVAPDKKLFVLIIDALDECDESRAPEDVLCTIASQIDTVPFLKVLVCSRPTSSTNDAFLDETLSKRREVFVLHDVEEVVVQGDITNYIIDRLERKAKARQITPSVDPWPPRDLVSELARKAAGLFIYASTVCEFIEARGDLEYRLNLISNMPVDKFANIDSLYRQILQDALNEFHQDEANINDCILIVATIIHLFSPVSRRDLGLLLELPENHMSSLLGDLQPVIIVPERAEEPFRTLHASFREFIPDKSRCLPAMYVEPPIQHGRIASHLLRYMAKELKKEFYTLDYDYGMLAGRSDHAVVRRSELPGAVVYSCRHWLDHLKSAANTAPSEDLIRNLNDFVKSKLLDWVEVLELLSEGEGVTGVWKLQEWLNRQTQGEYPSLPDLVVSVDFAHQFAFQSGGFEY